jgi:site-specific recombinase XerD
MTLLRPLVAEYLAECRSRRLAPTTLVWYQQKLAVFVDRYPALDTHDLTALELHEFLASFPALNGHTVKGYAQCLRAFLRWCATEGEVEERLVKKVQTPKVEKRLIRPFTQEQFDRLLDACVLDGPQAWFPQRDQAILWMLLSTGLRASELCGLRRGDVAYDEGYVRVIGKGNKEREVGPFPPALPKALRRYLRVAPANDLLFVTRYHHPFTRSGLDQLLYRLERWAGERHFDGVRVSAHTFRHTYATNYLRCGGDIKTLSVLLGHTSVSTTERYLRDFGAKDARNQKVVSTFVRN